MVTTHQTSFGIVQMQKKKKKKKKKDNALSLICIDVHRAIATTAEQCMVRSYYIKVTYLTCRPQLRGLGSYLCTRSNPPQGFKDIIRGFNTLHPFILQLPYSKY